MSALSHLNETASRLIITQSERDTIDGNISALRNKLFNHFNNNQIKEGFAFGSYTRKTLMPRRADSLSDVDYMVVFENSSLTPATYLGWLRDFANAKYSKSEIYPSHPTIVLELSNIKIELVPAIKSVFYDDYQIPAPSSSYSTWLTTHPNAFNTEVRNKNTSEKSFIRPLIRLMKYWNANNGYPFSSYELEQLIVGRVYYSCNTIWDYLRMFVEGIGTFNRSATTANKIERLKSICLAARNLELSGENNLAENKIKEAFPTY
jgi:predicted nucleotidyltransferase